MGDMCYEGKLTTNVFYLLIPSMTIIFIYIIAIMINRLYRDMPFHKKYGVTQKDAIPTW